MGLQVDTYMDFELDLNCWGENSQLKYYISQTQKEYFLWSIIFAIERSLICIQRECFFRVPIYFSDPSKSRLEKKKLLIRVSLLFISTSKKLATQIIPILYTFIWLEVYLVDNFFTKRVTDKQKTYLNELPVRSAGISIIVNRHKSSCTACT